ncbi:MAG: NAD-dependent epimerase/dehydratase family protein [Bacteroidales bacterium]|nr:NAD-dependent epimerase/dehydratase family protein [Bacteroidales bacterium]
MPDKSTILITGTSGFVGTNFYHAFKNDYVLYGLDITKKGEFPTEDIYGWDEMEKIPHVETIIHLAGKAHDTSNTSDPHSYFEINLGLTKRIFDYFLKSDSNTFIFFSSVKAVADTVGDEILTEEAIPDPKTAYGKSKLEAEKYILGKSIPEGKKVFILRPCMIHGPGNKGNLNLLYKIVNKGIPWPLGAFENKRSFVSIDNLTFVIKQLIEKEISGGTYNIADDPPLSTNELIRLIAISAQQKPIIWNLPMGMIHFIARMGDVLHLPLNSERLTKLTESYVVSNDKIKRNLQIEEMPVSSVEGIKYTLKHL